jgi:hypothetical protein
MQRFIEKTALMHFAEGGFGEARKFQRSKIMRGRMLVDMCSRRIIPSVPAAE